MTFTSHCPQCYVIMLVQNQIKVRKYLSKVHLILNYSSLFSDRSRTAPTTPVSKKALPTNANDQASKRSIWNTTTGSTVLNATNNLQWSCTKCTFLNHPALSTCEECEMPRFNNSLNLPEEEVNDLDKSASNNCLCHAA